MYEHDEKVTLIRDIDIFSKLREYELDIIAKYSRFIYAKKGSPIFSQGSPADSFYVLREGRIGIIRNENNENVDLACIIKGESFGELDFLAGAVRTAAAFAEEDSVLLAFPGYGESFIEILNKHPDLCSRILYKFLARISTRIYNVNKTVNEKSHWLHELRKQLLSDKLTGLFNENFIKEEFDSLLPGFGDHTSLLIIKPDNFKEVNDNYGHTAGDKVLMLMSIFLQAVLGEDDIAVRFRGDEFAAILVNRDEKASLQVAHELSRTFNEMEINNITKNEDFKITVSIGLAVYPDHAGNSRDLAEVAYNRMLTGRNSGGNRVISA